MILASRGDRWVAQVVDSLIALALLFALVFLASMAPGGVTVVFSIAGLLLFAGYILFGDALPEGQSFGKRMMGIAVVDQRTGAPCSAWQSFLRNVMLAILGLFDWIFIFGEKHQRLGDMAAGTIVIDAPMVGAGKIRPGQERPRAHTAG